MTQARAIPSRRSPQLLTLLLLSSIAGSASAVELTFGGAIQSDIRFRVAEKSTGGYYNKLSLPAGVDRNQNLLKAKLTATAGSFSGVAEVDFVWNGFAAGLEGISDLSRYEKVSPYYLRDYALYLDAADLLPGLDLRVGQQLVAWGKGDQFNPTNNLNASDLQDPLYFGNQLANLMARLDYTVKDTWTISAVLVPLFKPAILPPSAPLGLAASDRMPIVEDALRQRIQMEKTLTAGTLGELGLKGYTFPTRVNSATPVLPEASLSNMQGAIRIAGVIEEQDIALSYYVGRTDMPQPFLNYSHMNRGAICDPLDRSRCVDGTIDTDVYLGYPRMQVLGLNMAGQVDLLGWLSKKVQPIGYRLEVGVYFPQEASITLLQDRMEFGTLAMEAGEYPYTANWKPGQPRPTVVSSTPFAKWTLGLDYTFNRFVYANVQWVHGMVDEFGAGDFISEGWAVRQGGVNSAPADTLMCYMSGSGEKCAHELMRPRLADYLVLGVDVKLLEDRALLRLFTIWDLSGIFEEKWDPAQGRRVRKHYSLFTDEGFSAVIYPELVYNFGDGLELGAGALMMLGRDYTKFGDPASGGSLIWTRAKFSY